ncbi:class I SAM-dependent methyltransferase [Bacillus sp. TL12]|uniref:class I SAM-dependent methyltransferase n=1 Tax=Bacillus sp. TL12 TaxID=2894756 RepID=UPI001F518BD6|nr:class I SAM-dependent methyltransferase [Bacillus sp. TL12]MCI0768220.1 class I SAM-dependent methyltransferase [Bacillus sp. TL12]
MEMLQKAKEKYPDNQVKFFHMDAQNLQFENQSFDTVVAGLILSVVLNPKKL